MSTAENTTKTLSLPTASLMSRIAPNEGGEVTDAKNLSWLISFATTMNLETKFSKSVTLFSQSSVSMRMSKSERHVVSCKQEPYSRE